MDDPFAVQFLQSHKELVKDNERCIQRELILAICEQVLQAGPKQLERHELEVVVPAKPVHRRKSLHIFTRLISLSLPLKEGRIDGVVLEFDGYRSVSVHILRWSE